MNTSTFVWLLLAVQLVKSKSDVTVKVKDSSDGAKLDDLVAEYLGMDPPSDDLFEAVPSAGEMVRNPLSVRVIQGGANYPSNYQLNTSSILIFDSVENFVEHVRSINWLTNPRFRHPHLVYIPGVTLNDILEHIEDGFLIDQVGFLVHAPNGSILLATSYMFTKEKCRTNQLVTINRFSNNQIGWENKNFYPQKYIDFHGCNLTRLPSSSDQFFNDFASTLNVSIWENTTAVDLKDIDLIGEWSRFEVEKEEFIISDEILITDFIWIVPPGEPYSQFEKMFLPFDTETWILICLTFFLAFITVELVKLCPMKVQNFVFGRNFRTPTLNIIDIFLNGGQRCVPFRNFSRYILTLFTIWCLIIRTCYQSKTFDFLQADMRKPGPTSFEDMGYTAVDNEVGFDLELPEDYYVPTEYGKPMNRTKFSCCFKPGTHDTDRECLMIVADPANRAFTFSTEIHLLYYLNRIGHGNPSFVILDNKIRTLFQGVKFKRFCPFYETFNQKIGFYITSGIPQHSFDKFFKPRERGLTWKDDEMGPQVLTLDDLRVGFVIHLVCLGISTLVFFLELIPIRVKIFARKVIMLNVLVAYFRNLFYGGAKLTQKRKFIKVKPKSTSNSRVQLEVHAEVVPKAENSDPKLESLPQCPTESASSFRLVDRQAGSSTREVEAEELGSLETSIDDEFGPRPEVQTVNYTGFPRTLLIHAEVYPIADSSDPKLSEEESIPSCPTESASDFPLVDLQSREIGAETLIEDIFGPTPEVQAVEGSTLPWTLLEDGTGGFIDISDLDCEDDWKAAGFSPLRKAL